MADIDWEKIGNFVEKVGIPFSLVLLVLGPIIYAIYKLITTQGPELAKKHNEFLDKTAATNDRNADSIAMMAAANTASQANHEATHSAIKELVRGARKAVDKMAPELSATVVPHLDRAEQAIEKAG